MISKYSYDFLVDTNGNIYKDTLYDVWVKSEKLTFLRNIRRRDFPKCINCEAQNYCTKCLVRNYNESTGDMFAIPPHTCDVAFLNKRLTEQYYPGVKK